ncbi:hypothetical protein EWM64_g1075 [Hericium alpestre]|uniref:NAD(P)-binding domain-containing protein n=1 Tax=Hericium alpestre TaxID=135208 RepID=A0A4Z0A9C8_9AGAM|nr:hypothetical protein EWM64_g1075 [Hericium alpestre]
MARGKIHIFVTGATGYIGGSVIQELLNHPKADQFEITAYVRNEDRANKLNGLGLKTALGSLDDTEKLAELASQADIVINMADADHYKGNMAILEGLKKKHEKTGKVPILIHTSGTGVLTDDAAGEKEMDTIYYDNNPEQIESLPDTQIHRDTDLKVVEADKQGYARTYIILPGTIYGIATGKLFDLGISNPHSVQVPWLVKASLARGQAGVVGEGKNLWPNVDIRDVAQLYITVFNRVLENPDATPHGREGFFFAVNGEHRLIDVSKEIGKAVYELGKSKTPEVTTFTDEENQKFFGGTYLGTNSRARAENSKSIGWKPTRTTKDFLASIKPEVEALAAKQQ